MSMIESRADISPPDLVPHDRDMWAARLGRACDRYLRQMAKISHAAWQEYIGEGARAELARRALLEADLTPDELRVSEEQTRAAVPVARASWRAAQYELHLCELDAELAAAT